MLNRGLINCYIIDYLVLFLLKQTINWAKISSIGIKYEYVNQGPAI